MNFLGNSVEKYVDLERMDEIILKTLRTFRNIFPPCYKNSLLETIMNRGKVFIDSSYILNSAPLHSTPLKVGILLKRGDHMKTWKKRQFTAYNEADNYVIAYGRPNSSGSISTSASGSGSSNSNSGSNSHNHGHGSSSSSSTDSHSPSGADRKKSLSTEGEISRFSCSGYHVEVFSEDETLVYGEHGIKLVPTNPAKRCWILCATNAAEHSEWMMIFAHACRKSVPVRDPDVLVREAFAVAYQQTRQLFGYFGSTNLKNGTELELLHSLVLSVLERELIDDLVTAVEQGTLGELLQYAPVSGSSNDGAAGRKRSQSNSSSTTASGSPTRKMSLSDFNPFRFLEGVFSGPTAGESAVARQHQVNAIRRLVESKVRPAVKLCWEHCREEVIGFSADYIARVTPMASEILACEEAIEEALYAPVVAHIDSVHTELQYRLLTPLASICGPSIVDAYEMALRSLFMDMSQRIGKIMSDPAIIDTEISSLLLQVERNSVYGDTDPENLNANKNNLLLASKEILINMSTVGLSELADDFVGSITPEEIYFRVMDDLRALMHDAVFSFGFALKNQGVTNRIITIFNEIILKLCTDMSTKMRVSFFQILQEVSESSVQVSRLCSNK